MTTERVGEPERSVALPGRLKHHFNPETVSDRLCAHRLRYQELFEFSPDSQLLTDQKGVILEANHAAAALMRCRKEFLIGKPLGLLLSEGFRSRFYECLGRLGRTGGSDVFVTQLRRQGEDRDVDVRVAPTGDRAHGLATFRWFVRDLTDRNRAEAARTELLRRLVTAQEDERRRIAREIHDQLGQELTGLSLGLKLLEAELADGTRGCRSLQELQQAVDRIGRRFHEMALDLRPTALDDLGLGAALDLLIRRWSEQTGVPVDFHFAPSGPGRFAAEIETTVYRVVQEALTNVGRHAGAGRVSVIVEHRDKMLLILVEDDGRGFDPYAVDRTAHLGLSGMNERVLLVGGSLQIESSPEGGATLRARIPCTPTCSDDVT